MRYLLVLLLVGASLGGCALLPARAPEPPPVVEVKPDPLANPGREGALAALSSYVTHLQAADFDQAYQTLAPSVRQILGLEDFAAVYQSMGFRFKAVEIAEVQRESATGIVLQVEMKLDRLHRYAEHRIMLRFEHGRWGVVDGRGLALVAQRSFEQGRWQEHYAVTERWVLLDPTDWRAQVERYYHYRDTGRSEEAEAAILQALELAPPEDQPYLYDLLARLYHLDRDGVKLEEAARQALAAAEGLGLAHTGRYDVRWRAGPTIRLAFAYRFQGRHDLAERYYLEAKGLDAANMDVERFWRTQPAR